MEGTILYPEPIFRLNYTEISATYTLLAQIENPSVSFVLQNLTNQIITYSWDGVDDHVDLPPNGHMILDVSANKSLARPLNGQQNQTIYVKGEPTTGRVNLTSFFAR
jgi:hypothetical protein